MKRPRVLIADDDAAVRRCIEELLDGLFEIVGDCGNGEELLEAASRLRPDAIVTDIFMPRLDGLATRARLIARGQAIPIVFVSALGKEVVSLLPSEPGVAFVYKGDASFHLVNAVEAVLAGRRYVSPHYR